MNAVSLDQAQRRRAAWVVPIVGIAALALAAGGWLYATSGDVKAVVKADEDPPLELAPADVATVELRALSRVLPISGTILPLVEATIRAKVSGEVLEEPLREGQVANKGDVLVRIDTRNLQAQYDSQLATLEKAKADLQLATQNRDNSKALLEQHFISQNAYDSTVNAWAADVANVKLAEAQLRLVAISLEDSVVRAPFDGTVSKRLVQPGEKVSPDTALIGLVDLKHMELQAAAPSSEVPSVKVGQLAHFRVTGFGDRRFEARVQRINPVAEEGSRSVMVYLAVSNDDGALKGGMFAQGELTLDRTQSIPTIPVAALYPEAGIPYVFVLKDGAVDKKLIVLGLRAENEGYIEVRDGLATGDRVIVAKIDTLKPGTRAVMNNGKPAPPGTASTTAQRTSSGS